MTAPVVIITESLRECEEIIERGLTTFMEVGGALLRIRDGRLYRNGYRDFETYCQARWAFSRVRAHQLIGAAEVVERLSTIVNTPLPANEAQARELGKLKDDPAAMAEVWNTAQAVAGDKPPTAHVIREVREALHPDPAGRVDCSACGVTYLPDRFDAATGLCLKCAQNRRNVDDDPALTEEECEALDRQVWDATDPCDCGMGTCECVAGFCDCAEKRTPRITGTDGKSYPAPAPTPPRASNRKPLPDAFWRATFDLGKEVKRIQTLAADDRFSKNADQISQANLHDLIRARDALQCVIDQLTN